MEPGDRGRLGERIRVRRPRDLSPGRDGARQGLVPAGARVVGLDRRATRRRCDRALVGARRVRATSSARAIVTLGAVSSFDLKINVPPGAALGAANLDVSVDDGGVSGAASVTFQIQEFRRPEFEVVTRAESAGPYLLTQPVTVAALAQYFSGGVLAGRADGLAGDDQLDHVHAAELVAVHVR